MMDKFTFQIVVEEWSVFNKKYKFTLFYGDRVIVSSKMRPHQIDVLQHLLALISDDLEEVYWSNGRKFRS